MKTMPDDDSPIGPVLADDYGGPPAPPRVDPPPTPPAPTPPAPAPKP